MNQWKKALEKKWIWYALSFGIPFVVSICICAGAGIYPFGNNCILHVDMYHQYCPFFTELREKLTTGGSLLYSWNVGLGSDFLSLYAYYLSSPMNWLLVLCPQQFIIEFMTFTTWVKIALAGLAFFYYLKEHFHLVGKDGKFHFATVAPALVFSTCYAFSGFVATYSWNIMWMDSIALLPLVILGLERLVKKKKPMLYYLSLAGCILCNFYISVMICIFLCLYFVILFLEQKKDRFMATVRFGWYSLLAGGTGAILIIPTAIMLGLSGSSEEFPETMKWYFGIVEELSRLCTLAPPYTGNDHWPSLYCGAFTVFLVVLYIYNRRISWKEKLPRLLLLVFFLLSFANNYLDYIWHGLRFPTSLPCRQAFLFIFLMLVVGFETYRKRKGNELWHGLLAGVLCIGTVLFSWQSMGKVAEDTDLKIETYAFVATILFLIFYLIAFVLFKKGGKKIRTTLRWAVVTIALGEVILNMAVTGFYSLSRTSYLAKMDDYHELIDLAEQDAISDSINGEKIFYRIEDFERKTKNDDCLYGYPSATVFSTLMNLDISHFYQKMYMEGGKNYYSYNGATPIISSMLSVRYLLSDNDQGENSLRTLIGQSGKYYLYENKYSLPLGFMMSEEAIEAWDLNLGNKINQINSLATALGAEDYMMVRISDPTMDVEAGKTTIHVKSDGYLFLRHTGGSASTLSVSINGGPATKYNKASHSYLIEVGECKAGDEVTITNTDKKSVNFYVYRMRMMAVEQAYETLCQQTMTLDIWEDTYLKGHIEVKEAGRLIFSIADEPGWSLYVDGVLTEVENLKDAFISVHLEEGSHVIELRYRSPGLIPGALLSLGSAGLFVATMWVRRKMGEKYEKKNQHSGTVLQRGADIADPVSGIE